MRILFALSLLLVVLTAWFNHSILAVDDYSSAILKCIPAQNIAFSDLIANPDVRNPIPGLVFLFVTKTALAMGITAPLTQLAFARLLFGLFAFLVTYASSMGILRLSFSQTERKLLEPTLTVLLGFFAGISLLYTRLMFECIAMPLISLFVYLLVLYERKQKLAALMQAIVVLTLSCLFRPQAGILIVIPFAMLFLERKFAQFFGLGVFSLFAFVVAGLPDLFWYGKLHDSLQRYARYNIEHANDYIQGDLWAYFALFLGMSLPPALFFRYPQHLFAELKRLALPIMVFSLFLVAHSLLRNKQERFMIPVLSIYLLLLTPIVAELIRAKRYIRLGGFLGVHAALNLMIASETMQVNVISFMASLENQEKEITTVYVPEENGYMVIPTAYVSRKLTVKSLSFADLAAMPTLSCDSAIMLRHDLAEEFFATMPQYQVKASFSPQMLESLVIAVNPTLNARRGKLDLVQASPCF